MKIGVMNGTVFSQPRFPVSLFADVAVAAEQLGFDGYFSNDHLNLPWGDDTCHPQIQIAYTVAKTRVIDLGNVVLPIPDSPETAKMQARPASDSFKPSPSISSSAALPTKTSLKRNNLDSSI